VEGAGTPLTPNLYRACEAIGQVVELWGFKRVHGMIWMYLYLQGGPVGAKDIQTALGISAGLVSMSLAELSHWSVVQRQSAPGERKDYYTAESNIGRPILKVLREREQYQIGLMLDVLRAVREGLDPTPNGPDAVALRQLDGLIRLGELGYELMGRFLDLGGVVLRDGTPPAVIKDVGRTLMTLRQFLNRSEEGPAGGVKRRRDP
jgi:DNA-binding transcriptional regulator GbsR (MarR family)